VSWELRLGDCLDPVTGLASLADKSVDHVICDPPYEAEAHTQGRRVKPRGWQTGLGPVTSTMDFDAMTDDVRDAVSVEIGRVARRWALVFCQVEAVAKWRDSLVDGALSYRRTCAFVKLGAQPQLSGDRPGMGYESIVCAHAPGRSRWNGGGKVGVYECPRAAIVESRKQVHMAEKPLPLMESLVRDFTDPGDLILDPFAGSGSTGVAAIRNGRRFIGWEGSPVYHATAIKRLQAAREQLALFGSALG
jgi:site-specific DNA-methyltransferase (adenine-specific)